ncbi:DUF4362 domain-containing protein [Sporosarcina sp. ACRSM]|uniref:DUF4362 domain-containing protein n=1 Tax=Sporosarcina sp. ACRSM TaxID=2918216 RepID=UPI001EF47132|nr:DUF4362 domain-containing protein [Sporosarcina sp. ACRSM]MCG7335049.1 DUF4362 domain-containing protein [Sporosarcina sp. ACRSM]
MKKISLVLSLILLLTGLLGCQQKEETKEPTITGEVTEIPYTPEEAIANGDIVNLHGKTSNLQRLNAFRKHVNDGVEDEIRITIYTVEGAPIFYDLDYDGEMIQYTYDNSHDGYAGSDQGRKSTSCSKFVSEHEDNMVKYSLSGCSSEIGDTFYFTVQE